MQHKVHTEYFCTLGLMYSALSDTMAFASPSEVAIFFFIVVIDTSFSKNRARV